MFDSLWRFLKASVRAQGPYPYADSFYRFKLATSNNGTTVDM